MAFHDGAAEGQAIAAVDEIYAAITDEDAYARLPGVLAAATQARGAILIEFDAGLNPYGFSRHGITDAQHERFVELGLAEHDVWTQAIAAPAQFDRAVLCEQQIDADRFRQTVFYNELFRPFGDDTARCLGVVMRREEGFMSLGLHRAYGQRPFDEQEAHIVDGLTPHLRRLSDIRSRLSAADQRLSILKAALDEAPGALLVLTSDGRLRHANAKAELLLRTRSGLSLQGGVVRPIDPIAAPRFEEAVRAAATRTGDQGDAMHLRRPNDKRLRVLVAPLTGTVSGALVLIDDPNERPSASIYIAKLYGLTPAEARLADLLADNHSPSEIAELRSVSMATVRSQISAIQQKTETRSLGDLLRTLGGFPRIAS